MRHLISTACSPFHTCPIDSGQMVEVSYALGWEQRVLVQRTIDRSESTTPSYRCARIVEDSDWTFEPWNGVLPETEGEWEDCELENLT